MSTEEKGRNPHNVASDFVVTEQRYRKPPIIEALCEIYFAESAWDETVPGAFYEHVKNDFPQKRQRTIQEAQFTLGPGQAIAGVRQLPSWMQFVSDTKHRMIQLAQDVLVVNQLPPYPHFEAWESDVHRSLSIYKDLAHPRKIRRLGLRYIDHVEIPQNQVAMEDYFMIYPKLPPALGNTHGPFLVRVEVPQTVSGHSVIITFGTALRSGPEPVHVFTLDFYDIAQLDKPLDQIDLAGEIRQAHRNVIMAFEDSITDKLRELFEPEN